MIDFRKEMFYLFLFRVYYTLRLFYYSKGKKRKWDSPFFSSFTRGNKNGFEVFSSFLSRAQMCLFHFFLYASSNSKGINFYKSECIPIMRSFSKDDYGRLIIKIDSIQGICLMEKTLCWSSWFYWLSSTECFYYNYYYYFCYFACIFFIFILTYKCNSVKNEKKNCFKV